MLAGHNLQAIDVLGGVTVAVLNINNAPASITIDGGFPVYPRLEYHLTAPDGTYFACMSADTDCTYCACMPADTIISGDVTSAQIMLNGQILAASASGALPSFNPISVDTDTPVVFALLSYGFVVFPGANARACM